MWKISSNKICKWKMEKNLFNRAYTNTLAYNSTPLKTWVFFLPRLLITKKEEKKYYRLINGGKFNLDHLNRVLESNLHPKLFVHWRRKFVGSLILRPTIPSSRAIYRSQFFNRSNFIIRLLRANNTYNTRIGVGFVERIRTTHFGMSREE